MTDVGLRCGTTGGYGRHQRAGERPCDACAAAKSTYDARWRAGSEQARRSRLKARAQGRARGRLAVMYPDDYARLYAEAKAEVAAEQEAG